MDCNVRYSSQFSLMRPLIILLSGCVLLGLMLIPNNDAHSMMVELGGNFGYDQRVYGDDRQNSFVERTYSASTALYFFTFTAVELDYNIDQQITGEHNTYPLDGLGYSVIGRNANLETTSYQIGIRQALARPDLMIVPSLSLGYAKQFVESSGEIYIENDTTKSVLIIPSQSVKRRYDSVFGAFQIKVKITGNMYINGSIKTSFPYFEYNQAKNFIRYQAGFSWLF